MKNKPFFLSIISIVLTIFLFPFSSCTISPVTTASSSSFATAQSETTSSSTPAIVTPDSKYKVQIKNPKEVLESITPVVFSTKYPLDLNYGGNGWDTVDSIISDVSCSDADIGQVSASDLTVITSGDEKAEIEGFLIYTIDGDFLAIYAADQLPQLFKGTYYVVAIMKNEDVIICFKVIQTKEPIKKYFLYEDAENEKGIIVQGNDQIEVPSLLYDYTSIYEKGYIDMCIYTTSQSNLKAYVDKHEEMPIFSSKKGSVSFHGKDHEKSSGLYIFKDTGENAIERFESVDVSQIEHLEKGEYYCLFTWGRTGRYILGMNETYSFCAAFKYIVE